MLPNSVTSQDLDSKINESAWPLLLPLNSHHSYGN